MTSAPARLFVLLAREAPIGVIFRRGPTKLVQVIKWNTAKDTFEPGQWFKGRIYEHRSDVSPDGKLMVYLAATNKPDSFYGNRVVWTGISKPPYLSPLYAINDFETYGQGGMFLTNETLLYSSVSRVDGVWEKPHPKLTVVTIRDIYFSAVLYYKQLEKNGWLPECDPYKVGEIVTTSIEPCVWHKQRQHVTLFLRYQYLAATYYLHNNNTGHEITLDKATWADFDQKDRLIYARDGKLFAAKVNRDELHEKELADFTANTFESIEAPEWAKTW
jgi:hypothetical protein